MKWEKYKLLTKIQKEEYNYKFKDRQPVFNITGLLHTIIFFFMTVNLLVFTTYLIISDKLTTTHKDKALEILQSAIDVSKLILPIVLFGAISETIRVIIFFYKKRKWLKQNGY